MSILDINKVTFRAPSNIAFIKYWGKYGRQLPMNPSISMTLTNCYTETTIEYIKAKDGIRIDDFLFENKNNDKFRERVEKFLSGIIDILPELNSYALKISTNNSFPHSAGIASSASGMAALACCLVKIARPRAEEKEFKTLASEIARLASGSACRSLFDHYGVWGEVNEHLGSLDHAVRAPSVHKNFLSLQDSILIVDAQEKAVSSSLGHSLMNNHPYKDARREQATNNMRELLEAMISGDFKLFGNILENEALSLHALMMSSNPSFVLLKPNSLSIIEKIRDFRSQTNCDLYFTIDAGPNMHLIYPQEIESEVKEFIDNDLAPYFINCIHDHIGLGAFER